MAKNQIVGLRSLELRSVPASMGNTYSAIRPIKKRTFTEDEYKFLCSLSIEELLERITQGDTLIALLNRPEMMNMTPASANQISSNLKFQQDEIRKIIKAKSSEV